MSRWQGMNWIRQVKRLAIYLRDGFQCCYCGADLRFARQQGITLDHLKPRCQGGSNKESNLVTACLACNSGRADRAWRQFAPTGAVRRIEAVRRRRLPMTMAKAIMEGRAENPRAESIR